MNRDLLLCGDTTNANRMKAASKVQTANILDKSCVAVKEKRKVTHKLTHTCAHAHSDVPSEVCRS